MADVATPIEWDDETFKRALERVRTEGTINAAGVCISRERLVSILQAAPRDPHPDGRPMLHGADFFRATFEGDANFREATFCGDASLRGQFSGGNGSTPARCER